MSNARKVAQVRVQLCKCNTTVEAGVIIRHGRTGENTTQTIYGCGEEHFQIMWMCYAKSGLIQSFIWINADPGLILV